MIRNTDIPPDLWDPSCPVCDGELDIDDGNGLLECPSCGWSERKSSKTVCGLCHKEVEKTVANQFDGFCRECFNKLRRVVS